LRTLFITGTDTGVGKTVLASLLLCHLRAAGFHALAMKPFCSGSRADADLLCALQEGQLTLDEVNPFYFREPIAPLVASRKHRHPVLRSDILASIRGVAARLAASDKSKVKKPTSKTETSFLIIEGSGGLLVPLGRRFSVRDLIASLRCEVIVVARNRLGTLNHTLLTVESLQSIPGYSSRLTRRTPSSSRPAPLKVVLVDPRTGDFSSRSNPSVLEQLIAPVPLVSLPFLSKRCCTPVAINKSAAKLKKTLDRILF
jgi:dethiobiotin synthetase